jgi:hypothetical protein
MRICLRCLELLFVLTMLGYSPSKNRKEKKSKLRYIYAIFSLIMVGANIFPVFCLLSFYFFFFGSLTKG